MYRCIRSEESVYRFIVRNYLLSLPPRRVEEGRYDVSMSCTEGVTKRRYRVLCSWWSLVPDNNMIAKKCSHLRNTVKFCTAFHEELDAAAEY